MATLDDSLKMNGVVAAGEFTADGKLVDDKAKMDMSREMAAMTAQFCAMVTMMFNTLAGAYAQLSGYGGPHVALSRMVVHGGEKCSRHGKPEA